jgi:conjugal transfer pilus assembly protein TraW
MLLDAHTRFSSHFFAALMLLLLSSSASYAGEDDFFIKEIMKEQHPNMSNQLPDWLKTQPATLSPVFEKLLRKGNNGLQNDGLPNTEIAQLPEKPIQGKWIFVSMGMPNQELKAAAEEASMTQSVLVFRGVEKGGDTGTITRRLYGTVKDIKPVPSAVIDPILFTRFNVQSVPTIIETNAEGETRIARGLPGFDWLAKQETGDLGQKGPVFNIVEPDMIEEMKRRMVEFDWEKEKEHALDNFWTHQKDSVNLPVSEKNTERRIDTSIVSTQDIFHPDGRLIIKKGQTINPQALMPMRHAYILFDATDKKQVEIAKKIGDEMLTKQKPVVYLFSKMDTDKGWEHYNKTTELMNAPIYKLNKTIIERFHIQSLPSVVEGQGDSVLVREIDARVLN